MAPDEFEETDSVQSFDSDEDFFDNWDPQIDRITIQRHERFLNEITQTIKKETKEFLRKIDQKTQDTNKPKPPKQKPLPKQQKQNTFPTQLTQTMKQQTPKGKTRLTLTGSSKWNQTEKNPCADGGTHSTNKNKILTQADLTPECQQVSGTTF